MRQEPGRWVLIYDPHCPLCNKSAHIIASLDKNGQIELGGGMDEAAAPKEFGILSPQGVLYEGEAAMERLIELLPPLRPLRWTLERAWLARPLRTAGKSAYRLMKTIRRCHHCPA